MQEDICHNGNLPIGSRILDDLMFFWCFTLSYQVFFFFIMFYFEHQEKQNKLMKKRHKIGGGKNINLMRKNRNQSWGEW